MINYIKLTNANKTSREKKMAQENEVPPMIKSATAASGIGFTMERVNTSASLYNRGSATGNSGNQRIGQPTFIDDPGLKADLFRAIESGDEIAVRKLIKHRVVINWHDVNGRSPLAIAAELGLSNVVSPVALRRWRVRRWPMLCARGI